MSFQAFLVNTVTVKKPTYTDKSGTKQRIPGEETVATGIKARIEPISGRIEGTILGQFPSATHRIFLDYGDLSSLKANYTITDENSIVYVVLSAKNFFEKHWEAIIEERH